MLKVIAVGVVLGLYGIEYVLLVSNSDNYYSVITTLTLDGPDVGLYTNAVILGDGIPFFVYYHEDATRLKAVYCLSSPLCEISKTVVIHEEQDYNIGYFVSMILASDGYPVMVYNKNYLLVLTKCIDAYCSSHHIEIIVNETARESLLIGGYTTITRAVDDSLVIGVDITEEARE